MRVILILFLILFLIVSSLFLTTFVSKMTGNPDEMELAAEVPAGDESISLISDIKPDTAPDVEVLEDLVQEEAGFQVTTTDSGGIQDVEAEEVTQEEPQKQDTGTDEDSGQQENTEAAVENNDGQEEEGDPEQDTVKIYLDGGMENGIYLGAASYGLDSSRAKELYDEDLSHTGFKFQWQNTDLDLEPGSTHFIYIYYYNKENGWDYLRKEINITGRKPGNTDIKIFIDEPTDQKTMESLERIRGWALDSSSSGSTGIDRVSIFMDGPKGFGLEIGEADYGIPRSGVADFFNNQDYLRSGYNLAVEDLGLIEGSKHTLFVYAESPAGANNYNFEKTDIYISGERQEKAVIEANIDIQALVSQNTLYIDGFAIARNLVEDYLQKQQEESSAEGTAGNSSNSSTSGSQDSTGYSIRKLVFKSNRDGNYNIYSINLDGSDWQRLTDNNGDDLYPEVSPDGKKIAYTADIGGVWQIVIMDWNGQNKRQMTNNSYRCAYPTWSYDMKYIFFEAYIDGDWELFRINSNGSGQKRLTYNSGGHDWHPSAHPFDTKVIFESGMPGHDDIYIMNNDGSAISRIFSSHERRRTPDLSPDSTKLVYTRYFGDNSEVYYADIRDQKEIRITTNGDWDGHPMFSPDGKLIVYEQRTGGREDLIIFDMQTGQKTNITNTGYKDSDACFMYQN